jgi:hypothetical protein
MENVRNKQKDILREDVPRSGFIQGTRRFLVLSEKEFKDRHRGGDLSMKSRKLINEKQSESTLLRGRAGRPKNE